MSVSSTVGGPEATGPRPVVLDGAPPVAVQRLRTAVWCLALVVIAFVQDPGLVARDTKLDLTVNPVGLMTSALHLWQPLQDFGTLENQAYGYLWPMGPFFALGHVVGLPGWVVQRCWWALLLVLAFLGLRRLAAVLGIGTPATGTIAALAYALSPRVLTTLGAISSEALPLCLAPWVLLPLVQGSKGGSERRAALRSGVALLCVGGVNAVATLWVVPLGALWLLTRAPGPRRRRLAGWWALGVAAAVAWWLLPLLLLGSYSPPFLDYIESATTTTARTSLLEVLRGTSHWIAYFGGPADPEWRAGWLLVSVPLLVLLTTVVAALGLGGLARRDLPHRRFLLLIAIIGLIALTFGHVSTWGPPGAGTERGLLDGVLAPLRNVHKADLLLRLPLVLGLAHLTARIRLPMAVPRSMPKSLPRLPVTAVAVVAAAAVLGSSAPALAGALVPRGAWTAVPDYWGQTADWLVGHAGHERALVVPGASFADQIWGGTHDEPLQPLARTEWAVRDAVPLAPPGVVRLLDALEARLDTGTGSTGLAPTLARAGVGYLVVRNDLDLIRTGAPRPVLVHQALLRSPGISRVAAFGSPVSPRRTDDGMFVDAGLSRPYPPVEIFRVAGADGPVQLLPASGALTVSGGPEALLTLADAGLLDGRATVLAGEPDPDLPDSADVVTDSLPRVERNYGRIRDATSPTLDAHEPLQLGRRTPDLLPVPATGHLTVAAYRGVLDVTASSSAADVDAVYDRSPAHLPFAALDGDPTTSWVTGADGPVGQWWQVRLREAVDLRTVTVVPAIGTGAVPTRVRITTDVGSRVAALHPGAGARRLSVAAGPTRRLRITVLAVSSPAAGAVGLAAVGLPGITAQRALVTPADAPGDGPPAVLLSTPSDHEDACVHPGDNVSCSPVLAAAGSEDGALRRDVTLSVGGSYQAQLTARPQAGVALDALLQDPGAIRAAASSAQVPDPDGSAQAAVDGDVATGWVARAGDQTPSLTVTLPTPRTVSTLRVVVNDDLAASHPLSVHLAADGQHRDMKLGTDGAAEFAPLTTRVITVSFPEVRPVGALDAYGGKSLLPVGVSELVLPQLSDLRPPPPDRLITVPCGQAPALVIDGRRLATRATASRGTLASGGPVQVRPCDTSSLHLAAGHHTVDWPAGSSLRPSTVDLLPTTGPVSHPPAPDRRRSTVVRWDRDERAVTVGAGSAPVLLVVHENTNPGWVATLEGHRLRAVRVDGWQQGWLLPAGGGGTVALRYTPDGPYRLALLLGLVAAAALVLAAAAPSRARGAGRPALVERALPVTVLAGAGIIVLGGVGGGAALLLAGGCAGLVRRRSWAGSLAVWAAVAALNAAVAVALLRGAGQALPATQGSWVQGLCLLALSAAVLAGAGHSGRGGRPEAASSGRQRMMLRKRRAGRSTR